MYIYGKVDQKPKGDTLEKLKTLQKFTTLKTGIAEGKTLFTIRNYT